MIIVRFTEKYAVVLVDIFDAQALSEGKVDPITKELGKVIVEKLTVEDKTGCGDDGSPVYDEKGNFIGMQIASSDSHQIISKAEHIRKALEETES